MDRQNVNQITAGTPVVTQISYEGPVSGHAVIVSSGVTFSSRARFSAACQAGGRSAISRPSKSPGLHPDGARA